MLTERWTEAAPAPKKRKIAPASKEELPAKPAAKVDNGAEPEEDEEDEEDEEEEDEEEEAPVTKAKSKVAAYEEDDFDEEEVGVDEEDDDWTLAQSPRYTINRTHDRASFAWR